MKTAATLAVFLLLGSSSLALADGGGAVTGAAGGAVAGAVVGGPVGAVVGAPPALLLAGPRAGLTGQSLFSLRRRLRLARAAPPNQRTSPGRRPRLKRRIALRDLKRRREAAPVHFPPTPPSDGPIDWRGQGHRPWGDREYEKG